MDPHGTLRFLPCSVRVDEYGEPFVMQPPIGDGTITLKVFIGLLKLTICFLFCVVAMNVVRRGLGWTMFRGFYSGAVLVSVFSIPQIIGFGSLVLVYIL